MPADSPQNILVISNCRMGDSIVMAPAFALLKKAFPQCRIALISERTGTGVVSAQEILGGRGLIDEFHALDMTGGKIHRLLSRLSLFVRLRKRHWDTGIVLFPPYPPLTMELVSRFRTYLKLAGAQQIITPAAIIPMQRDDAGRLLPQLQVIDATLQVLEPLGIPIPSTGEAEASLPPSETLPPAISLPESRPCLAVAPGTNMPSKCWPPERFATVLKQMSRDFGVVPVYFGGENDRAVCESLNREIPGILVIGLPLPAVEATMRCCKAYFGNDTGLMHLAAAAGLRCLAIFSARHPAGMWEPYGKCHIVLRINGLPCEGCQAESCPEPGHPCIMGISAEEAAHQLATFFQKH